MRVFWEVFGVSLGGLLGLFGHSEASIDLWGVPGWIWDPFWIDFNWFGDGF